MKLTHIAPKKFHNIQYDLYFLLQRCYYDTLTLNPSTVCINIQSIFKPSLQDICISNYILNSLKTHKPIHISAINFVNNTCMTITNKIRNYHIFSLHDKTHLGYAILNTNKYPYDLILLYKSSVKDFINDIQDIFNLLFKINIFICGKIDVKTLTYIKPTDIYTTNLLPYTLFNTCISDSSIHKLLSCLMLHQFTVTNIDNINLTIDKYTSKFKSPLINNHKLCLSTNSDTTDLNILTYKLLYTI